MIYHRQRRRGSILIMVAVVMPLVLAFCALAIDVGYVLDYKQRMGAAADAAALGGAFEVKANKAISQASLESFVRDEATRNGFSHGEDGVSVDVMRPPATGLHVGDSAYVEVRISRSTPSFFARMPGIGWANVPVGARAVAGPEESTACVYALAQTDLKYTTELTIPSSGDTISIPACGMVSNGGFMLASGSKIDAAQILVSDASGTVSGTVTNAPVYNVPPSVDPFSDLDEAALFGTSWTCGWTGTRTPTAGGTTTAISGSANGSAAFATGGMSYTLDPGVYCGDAGTDAIRIGTKVNSASPPGNCVPGVDDIITFKPGVYIVLGGGLDWKHSCVVGSGVTFYITGTVGTHDYVACGGKLFDTDPPDRFYLSAPTSGKYEGLLFIQDRTQAGACALPATKNPVIANILPQNMALDGAIYFPNHHITYGATTTASGNYTILIGGTITFTNKSTFNSNFSGLATGSPVKRPGLGE